MTTKRMRIKDLQGQAGALAEIRDHLTTVKEELDAECEEKENDDAAMLAETLDSVIGHLEEAISELEAI